MAQKTSLFLAYCPDRTGPGVLETRLKVRAEHFAGYKRTMEAGNAEFGRAFLPSEGDALLSPERLAVLPPNVQPMAGSVLMLRYPSLADAWARVKEDVYYTAGVWDPERVFVSQIADPPPSGTVAGVGDASAITGGLGKA